MPPQGGMSAHVFDVKAQDDCRTVDSHLALRKCYATWSVLVIHEDRSDCARAAAILFQDRRSLYSSCQFVYYV